MEEDVTLQCPCCSSTLGIDDAGELFAIEDKLPGKKGIRGIRTRTAGEGGDDWQNELYRQSEPKQYQPPIHMVAGKAGAPEDNDSACTAKPNQELIDAHQKDLKKRNIN